MARLESQAVAGYYPLPERLVPLIADLFDVPDRRGDTRVLDPVAGDGAAVLKLCLLLGTDTKLYACELEHGRHEQLVKNAQEQYGWGSKDALLEGDAFRADFTDPWVGLLYLNPPYDTDPVHGRLEQRFLERFTETLDDDGILVFVVPHYALDASALTLATEYDDIECLRFPEPEFGNYKQVVLVARKCPPRLEPDPRILKAVERWSHPENLTSMAELGSGERRRVLKWTVPAGQYCASTSWKMREVDMPGLLGKLELWRGVPGVLPELPVAELMFRRFPVATSPRPAHIAAGIASGLFNGRRVESKTKGLPPLLVKGVFEREYVTVEEKQAEDGTVRSVTQVQQPRLVVVVLDLSTSRYHELAPGGKSGSHKVEDMHLEDLLEHYGTGLLQVMREQCPVIYDPERDRAGIELVEGERELYGAQADAARALLQLLGANLEPRQRRGRRALLLGEIGVGKTSVVLVVANTIARRVLVMCPPHLLDSWTNEAHTVVPGARVTVLDDVADVDAFALDDYEGLSIAVLSREAAKLGHGYESVRYACPRCGSRVSSKEDHAKKRGTCISKELRVRGPIARAAVALALQLAPCDPENDRVRALLGGRHARRVLARYTKRTPKREWVGLRALWSGDLVVELLVEVARSELAGKALFELLHGGPFSPEQVAQVAKGLCSDPNEYRLHELGRMLTLLLPPGELCDETAKHTWKSSPYYSLVDRMAALDSEGGCYTSYGTLKRVDGVIELERRRPGTLESAGSLLAKLTELGDFGLGGECGEQLYQAVPEPRRYPLARYIAKRHPKLFDLLVFDEAHEYSTSGDTAQSHAAQRLAALGLPLIEMTGSVMNGYSRSLFTTFQIVSHDFREEFPRAELQRFVDRYGYRKRILTDRDRETGETVEFGSHSDRVVRSERQVGEAPGVLPLFLFRHLLRYAVTLHKADLALELPKCTQIDSPIVPSDRQREAYNHLLDKLRECIKRDQFVEGRAGKLFGALSELPSYLDRTTDDVGNREGGGPYRIEYPEALDRELVAVGECFPASSLLPKEKWMVELLKRELAEGRNAMVFTWHTELLTRLQRVLERELKVKAPILHASKVPTHKRQAWIEKEIVQRRHRLMIANPVTVQTGLNNLVHFSTEVWHENPGCNPIAFRQPIGRVDRIGQKLETRIYVPYYADTLQQAMHSLLMRKVAISIATDGLDPESVLIASGGSDDTALAGLSLGRQLWAILERQQREAAAE